MYAPYGLSYLPYAEYGEDIALLAAHVCHRYSYMLVCQCVCAVVIPLVIQTRGNTNRYATVIYQPLRMHACMHSMHAEA